MKEAKPSDREEKPKQGHVSAQERQARIAASKRFLASNPESVVVHSRPSNVHRTVDQRKEDGR